MAFYADDGEMAAHSADFDAVIIVTPHTSHIPLGLKFAVLGKHLLLDKPAGVSAGDVELLAAACREQGVSFGMIFNNRQQPAFRAAKKLLEAGALGDLHRAVWVCNSWYRSPAYHRSASWRSSWNGECGGLMLNQNPHYLDMWQWFFGLPDRVYADMQFGRYNDFLVDDAVDIQFSYDNGFHGTFISATGEAPGVNRLEIWGTKGKLTIEDGARVFWMKTGCPRKNLEGSTRKNSLPSPMKSGKSTWRRGKTPISRCLQTLPGICWMGSRCLLTAGTDCAQHS